MYRPSMRLRLLVYISRLPIDLAHSSFDRCKANIACAQHKKKNSSSFLLITMSTTFERAQMVITWLLLILSSWVDTGSARSLLKLKSSPGRIPLKETVNPIWRDPPGNHFRDPKSKLPQIPSPLQSDPKELRKIIRKFEPLYMSITKPPELNTTEEQTISRREIFARMPAELKNLHFTVPGSERELGERASKKLRLWLWNLSSCKVLPLWKDFGPTIWPRYVNIGQCQMKKTCSYPKGMQCKPAKYKRIYTLFWVCSEQIRKRKGTRCIWVPYPTDAIQKCKCSC